jgi:hypothetical protein
MLCGHQGKILSYSHISKPLLGSFADTFRQGKVYDVTGNKAYQPGGSYNGECTTQYLLNLFPSAAYYRHRKNLHTRKNHAFQERSTALPAKGGRLSAGVERQIPRETCAST